VLLAAFGIQGALAVTGAILPVLALVIYGRIGATDRVSVVDEELVGLVRRVEVFSQLPLTAIERLAAGMTPLRSAAGRVLMREGEPGETFVVVASGDLEVTVGGRATARLGPGSGFGEIALLRRSARTATVTAVTEMTGFEIDADTFACAVSGPTAAAITEQVAAASLRRGAAVSPSASAEAAALH
jgi:CRP-like cAMP-binding protein